MSCSPFDLRDYFLKELADPQQRQVEAHIKTCQPCREELDRLQLTESALFTLREEEIPQRIAFISDPVFEPSPWRRFFSDFWGSSARLGFASAAMLSAALVVFALSRPAGSPPEPLAAKAAPAAVQTVAAVSDAEIQARVDAAVAKAVDQSEKRRLSETKVLMKDLDQARLRLQLAAQEYDQSWKRSGARWLNAGVLGPPAEGDMK